MRVNLTPTELDLIGLCLSQFGAEFANGDEEELEALESGRQKIVDAYTKWVVDQSREL